MNHPLRQTSIRRHSAAFYSSFAALLPALILVGLATPSGLRAADKPLPKGADILDKYVEATGGKAAYAKLTNRVMKGAVEFVGQGLKIAITVYAAPPGKMYSISESEAFGKIEKGTDGKVVWELNLMTGPQIKEGDERAFVLRTSVFDGAVNWRKLFKKAECVGLEDVDGKPAYKVVLTARDGDSETRYYDQKSGLVVKTEMTLKLPAGPIPIVALPTDYKRVDGILLPYTTRVLVMGTERLVTTESIKHNVELPKDCFKLPDEIQALVDKNAKPAAKTQTP